MDKRKKHLEWVLYNAVIGWFDDQDDYKCMDDKGWIDYVCERTRLTNKQYKELMCK